jgi:hypothetical protein
MPNWVNLTDRIPDEGWEDNPPVIRAKSTGSVTSDVTFLSKELAIYHLGQIKYEIPAFDIEWLDEESNDPVFSLEDMKLCWIMCDELHSERSGHCLPAKFYKEFMKTKYNIDHE